MDNEEGIRLYFQEKLESVFPTMTVYYRPPGNLILSRPCIIYQPQQAEVAYANNVPYITGTMFQVTILSDLPGYMNGRSLYGILGAVVISNRTYTENDIVHDVYTVSVNAI